MPGETGTMAAFNNALKVNALLDRQVKMFAAKDFLLANLRAAAGKLQLGGRRMEVSLRTRDVASLRAQDEMEQIADADTIGSQIVTIEPTTLTARLRLSQLAVLSSEGNAHSWVNQVTAHMTSCVENFAMGLSRLLQGWGAGVLARVAAITPGAGGTGTIRLQPDQDETGVTPANGTFGPKYITKGMPISASANLTGKVTERTFNVRVTAVRRKLNEIDYTGPVGDLAVGDYIFLGSKEKPSKGRAPMGIMGYVDNGGRVANILGTDRTLSGNEHLQSDVQGGIGSQDLEVVFDRAMTDVENEVPGAQTSIIMVSQGIYRALGFALAGSRRFVSAAETGRYKGSFSMVELMHGNRTVPLTTHRDMPAFTAFGLDWDEWYMGQIRAAGWLTDNAKPVWTWVQDYLAFEAVYYWIGQLINLTPNRQWRRDGIAEV